MRFSDKVLFIVAMPTRRLHDSMAPPSRSTEFVSRHAANASSADFVRLL
jgi:hypothetical protein